MFFLCVYFSWLCLFFFLCFLFFLQTKKNGKHTHTHTHTQKKNAQIKQNQDMVFILIVEIDVGYLIRGHTNKVINGWTMAYLKLCVFVCFFLRFCVMLATNTSKLFLETKQKKTAFFLLHI